LSANATRRRSHLQLKVSKQMAPGHLSGRAIVRPAAGFVDKEELPSLLSSSDIYVSTSLSDAGIAASTAEAMSCEIPVIISDSAENDKWINNNVNGFLFSTKNSEQLAEILIKLIKDHELRIKVGKEGRNIIIKKNDYENEMKKVNDLYLKLV